MKKDDTISYLELYKSSLEYIDKKIPLLENFDSELIKRKKELKNVKKKLSGINFIVIWAISTIIGLVPMSLLNTIIDTTFNFLIITPVISFIVVFLYKIKYSKGAQKAQIGALSEALKRTEDDSQATIGEVNYMKNLADETLSRLMVSKEDYDITVCEPILVNLVALEYSYGNLFTDKSNSFKDAINHFSELIEDIKKNDKNSDLIKEYEKENIKAEYRKGAIKRCEK